MSTTRKTPKLRFPEFTDDWEQRKLSDISERVTRKNKNLEYSLPLTISAQYGLVDQHEFFNNSTQCPCPGILLHGFLCNGFQCAIIKFQFDLIQLQ